MTSLYDFIKDSINSDRPEKDIPRHFSEVSVMYNLFGGTDVDIYTSVNNKVIKFSILQESEEEALNLKQKINGTYFTTYGRTYNIHARVHKNTVYITMN